MTSQVNANQELFLDILTKEEKEALLTKKMEEIRKKNEALRKRHEEIEAEKRAVSGGTKKATSPRKESKPLPGEETAKESADGRKDKPRQHKPAGRGKPPNKGPREAPKAQDIRVVRNISGKDGSIDRSIQMVENNDGAHRKHSQHYKFQRPGSQNFPEEEAEESRQWASPRYQRPLSHEKAGEHNHYQRHSSNEAEYPHYQRHSSSEEARHHYQRHSSSEEDHRHYQRHSSSEEEQGRNQRRGKRSPKDTQIEEVSDGAYEALKRQHQQLNFQPRNQEFREHDFRNNRGRGNRRYQRPHFRNGDARQSFEDCDQTLNSGYQDNRHPQDESEFEPQAKRIHGGMKGFSRRENKGYDFSRSPLGPPPDPAYNFLSDRYRHGDRTPEKVDPSRRHPKNYGGEDFGNVKNRMRKEREKQDRGRGGPPRSKMEMAMNMTGRERREYVEWKAEREKVDQARIDRQKLATGEWKREWDIKKDLTEEVSQRVEPGKRPGPGRKDSKESGGKPQANGVGQERLVEKEVTSPRPVGRGRGRGRARNKGSSIGNDPGRVRTYSGEERHVECKKDLLVIKVDNTPGKKSDQVEVEYSDGENEPLGGDHPATQPKKAGPHAEELWWDEEGDDIGLELQGITAEDDIFEQRELFDDYIGDEYNKDSRFEDAPGRTSQGDEDDWEDCTTSEDFSTDRSQSQTSVSDDLNSSLRINLNPDAPVFTPASPVSPSPLAAKVSMERKLEEAAHKQKKTREKKKGGENTLSNDGEEKAPLDSRNNKIEHSKSDTDHADSTKAAPEPEELESVPSEEEPKGEVSEESKSQTTPNESAIEADTSPENKGNADENQTQCDPPTEEQPVEEAAQEETEKNSLDETRDDKEQDTETSEDTKEEKDDREDKEATPTPQMEEEDA
ncbi:coiled-coil domain-containing protein 9-like isoform X4 [Ostrea edulis]|uniref:coiled-coil domain-containing protein 9-like isoform X4 n=1 Tax=Ostrea edulis TaxID=37623 RepID=UPI0024AF85FF|nr:coiled-coil domain-containing protein 9-like isoform X4 [Ostrea edulis]